MRKAKSSKGSPLVRLRNLYARLSEVRPTAPDADDMREWDAAWQHGYRVGYSDARGDVAAALREILGPGLDKEEEREA